MKRLYALCLSCILLSASVSADQNVKPLTIRVVNFKTCVEHSKLGKQEQATFDSLKKQMESTLLEKEKSLNEIASKFEDPDYLDSLSAEAETDLKRKFRSLSQELNQLQSQYYQALQQSNVRILQKLQDEVTKAAQTVAKNNKFDLVLNEEGCFFTDPSLDVSKQVITILDENFDKESSTTKSNQK